MTSRSTRRVDARAFEVPPIAESPNPRIFGDPGKDHRSDCSPRPARFRKVGRDANSPVVDHAEPETRRPSDRMSSWLLIGMPESRRSWSRIAPRLRRRMRRRRSRRSRIRMRLDEGRSLSALGLGTRTCFGERIGHPRFELPPVPISISALIPTLTAIAGRAALASTIEGRGDPQVARRRRQRPNDRSRRPVLSGWARPTLSPFSCSAQATSESPDPSAQTHFSPSIRQRARVAG